MNKVKDWLTILLGFMFAVAAALTTTVRLTSEVVGISTSPGSTITMIKFLLTQPPWVAGLVSFGLLLIATWLVVHGVKSLVSHQKMVLELPAGYMTAEQADRILKWSEWFRNEWVKEREQLTVDLAHKNAETSQQVGRHAHDIYDQIVGLRDDVSSKLTISFRDFFEEKYGDGIARATMAGIMYEPLSNDILQRLVKLDEAIQRLSPPDIGKETQP